MTLRDRPIVLHVDDDAVSQIMAEGALEEAGFDVIQASDGLEGVEQFKKHGPDLIIMDAVMPNMDGFESIAHIRKMPMGEHTPILMITGLDDLDSITRAYNEGATDFLTKPINFFVLPHRVQYMMRSKLTADALRSSQAKLDNAQRIARLGHWEWIIDSGELFWSREFARILQFPTDVYQGSWSAFLDCISEEQRHHLRHTADHAVEAACAFSVEFSVTSKRNDEPGRSIRLEAEPHLNESGHCTHMLGTMQDITERTNAQKQIHNLAYFDLVTGLPNRAQLQEQLKNALSSAHRNQTKFALLFLDLDRFKQVNDMYGHHAGDELLKQVSERLTLVIRDSDSICRGSEFSLDAAEIKHTIARLGGDEFVVLLAHVNRPEDAARVAERIAESIRQPYRIGENDVSVTTTIGISVYPADGRDAETMMKHADVAMYHAKEQGRNGFQFYSRGIHEQALARFSMESELKVALEQGQLSLVYQPKIDLAMGSVVGVEALLRWEHPEKGMVSPAEFIPLAEETGLILPLGQWVLREACAEMQRWLEQGMAPLTISVNCSPVQFIRGNVIEDIEEAIRISGMDSKLLEIELTESLFLQNIDEGICMLNSMKELGIKIAIDDFGTGFSSLSYLKRLPVDKLKIDQAFVHDLSSDPRDAAIVSAIITLSHNLGLTVVAEGVESEQQLNILRSYGCDEVQGFFVGRPMDAADLEAWMKKQNNTTLRSVSGL